MSGSWRSGGWRWLTGVVLAAVVAALVAGAVAERRVLAAARVQALVDARLRAALLDSELARFRLLPLALADDRDVLAAVDGAAPARHALDRKLERIARLTGAAVIYAIAPDGIAIAASNWRDDRSFVGSDYRFRRYFRDAQARGAASQFALGTVSGRPGLYLAGRTANRGVIVVKLEFDALEREWARAGGITLIRDAAGVVLVTSRAGWRFATSRSLTPADAARFRAGTSVAPLSPLPLALAPSPAGERVRGTDGAFVAQAVPAAQPGWRLTLLRPVDAAVSSARRTASAGAALAALALALLAWSLRRRVTSARARTADLERAVAERTADLRREIDERTDSEARAADLREALRQANRLASLGQITASVAHETAQPVAAIRTYAQTSATLLDRGALAEVAANLTVIARLADRIGAVTAQLRGFSRRQQGEVRSIVLAEVIDGATLILREQLRSATLVVPAIPPALAVIGGKVRLEQVLVNLLQNAIEAMNDAADGADSRERRIVLALSQDADHVRLTVSDTGPGIAPEVAARLFTPFVTSRPTGLGLGLVIAQDIMVELGGWLRLLPSDRDAVGGAVFEMGMKRAGKARA